MHIVQIKIDDNRYCIVVKSAFQYNNRWIVGIVLESFFAV